ncbi:DHHA1 domain-containing protein [Bacillus salitolerans]|uniref:DHHA1 domain-containing protein n=1 Tax=Bacillus salitolerans TaxID=1437434 RepID=A0ABW4LQB9_9BACI
MTHKLYYDDPYIHSFSSNVLKQDKDETGNWYVVLQETAFYPTGGGQPHDTGTLGDSNVINVEEIDGEIRHYLDKELCHLTNVEGQVNWDRRFDHMQQHAGQHILSAAFEELYEYKTVSFHLGKEFLTIDLDIENLSEDKAQLVESLANKIVREGRLIETRWVSNEELNNYTLRKEISVKEDIRLVIIPDFDYNGCGGTHPLTTSQVGVIKILGWERQNKIIRLQFICGNRVLSQFQSKHRILTEVSQLISSPEEGIKETISKLLENMKQQAKCLEEVKDQLLIYEAKDLMSLESYREDDIIILCKVFDNRPISDLQKIARYITDATANSTTLFVTDFQNRMQILCASGEDSSINSKEIVSKALPIINGKGGGNARLAQGGGDLAISKKLLLEKMSELVYPK